MARLNESTTSAESIEVLKRRFVRQNREIARVNSIQSLRIRSLEAEVSHLLSENVSLREQIINLSQELERFEAAKLLNDGIYDIKTRLGNKLMELNNLVNDLGALPRKFGKYFETSCQEQLKSLDSRPRVAGLESNPTLGEDGRLPVILEDKFYPRKTLESQEIQDLVDNDLDIPGSPGSPAIEEVSFSQPETNDGDLSPELPEGLIDVQTLITDADYDDALLPPTLETRKKKRLHSTPMDDALPSAESEPSIAQINSRFTLKKGAKRKFNMEDDQQVFGSMLAGDDDDFQFSRPSHSPQRQNERFVSARGDCSPMKKEVQLKRGMRSAPAKRKALESKSTNLSMTSPNKLHAAMAQDKDRKVPARFGTEKDENHSLYPTQPKEDANCKEQSNLNKKLSRYHPDKLEREEDEDDELVAELNKSEEELKPSSPSVPGPQLQNDPEAASDMFNARPSRRQRAVVSYAEPNLRDKMRRPTKELVAAVGGDSSRRTSSSQAARANIDDESDGRKGARQSRSSDVTDRESNPPTTESSGTSSRSSMSMVSQRKRKTLPANNHLSESHDTAEETAETSSGASTQGRELGSGDKDITVDLRMEKDSKAAQGTNKHSRRHSSNPRSSGQYPLRDISNIESQSLLPSKAFPDISAATISSDYSGVDKHISEEGFHAQLATSEAMDDKQIRRGQRAAARRRSMML